MIKIYTSIKAAMQAANNSNREIILINDRVFEKRVSRANIDASDEELIRLIDNATVMGDGIVTPYGETTIYNLSTGCKTAININHILKQSNLMSIPIVSINECEGKPIELIFDMVDNTDIEIVLAHTFLKDLVDKEYKFYIINRDKAADNIYDLIAMMGPEDN